MKAFLVQLDVVWEDRPANFAKVKSLLEGQSIPPGSLIVLPEMFATGFTMNLGMTIESDPSETEAFLSELAQIHQSTVLGGLVGQGGAGKGRNEAVVMGVSGQEVARYCKLQPFTFSGEADVHEKGEDVVVFEWDGFVVSPLICYDLRFPEVFRLAAKRGAGLMVVIAQWPSRRTQHWVTLSGEVSRPGRYPLEDDTTLSRLIESAGGLTPFGNEKVTVRHPDTSEVEVDLGAVRDGEAVDPVLSPGDHVMVKARLL